MPEQTLRTEYAVVARSSRPGPLPFVLKDAETFGILDPMGDIRPEEGGDLGVFHEGTRHISRFEVRLWGMRPLLLSSAVREDNCALVAHLTNPDLNGDATAGPFGGLPKGMLHVQRASVLTPESFLQRFDFTSYADVPVSVPVSVVFDADFRDVFEVRGMRRMRRGESRREAGERGIRIVYHGLDGRRRVSALRLGGPARCRSTDCADFEVDVPARGGVHVCFGVDFREPPRDETTEVAFDNAEARAIDRFRTARRSAAHIYTSNEQFNQWINRSFSDVHMLATDGDAGPYSYAGVPWFSAPFGRDGIITAREMLTVEPRLARGVLGFLADRQATDRDPENDAEPGKILHEARLGEMAALGEVPFGRYYGSIDSTPLFLMLAWDYLRRTNDRDFIRSIWENIEAAAEWLEQWGDRDEDGFVEYERGAASGLRNQGWKDSEDAVSHADGALAEGPIALCEVQAYAYAAFRATAQIGAALGWEDKVFQYDRSAEQIRDRFARVFWRPELGTFAMALDGAKRPCDVRASNAGHTLWAGIATPGHAASVIRTLFAHSSFNGWGIRTLDNGEARYNPMSYHNGSVWPHDNALIALGLSRYGYKHEVVRLMTGLFDASIFMPMHRLPELLCGFDRRENEGPTLYPVACMPQAWASGAVFALLEAATGLSLYIDPQTDRPTVRFTDPVLPPYLHHLRITNLRVGDEEVDLELHRYDTDDVGVQTTRRSPSVDVVITK